MVFIHFSIIFRTPEVGIRNPEPGDRWKRKIIEKALNINRFYMFFDDFPESGGRDPSFFVFFSILFWNLKSGIRNPESVTAGSGKLMKKR